MSEIRAHPYTTVSAMLALAGVITMAPGQIRGQQLETRMASLESSVRTSQSAMTKRQLEAEVRRLDQAIFDLQARMTELQKTGEQPDRFYFDRLRELTADKAAVERNLAEFTRIHPELIDAE